MGMKKSILFIVILLVLSSISLCGCNENKTSSDGFNGKDQYDINEDDSEIVTPVAAPNVEGKIKGYWSSRANMIRDELDDAEEMKAIGINTVTFSPQLSHTQEGEIIEFSGSVTYIKKSINLCAKALFENLDIFISFFHQLVFNFGIDVRMELEELINPFLPEPHPIFQIFIDFLWGWIFLQLFMGWSILLGCCN